MPKTVYFAHSMRDYGTDRAKRARAQVESRWRGWNVLDPERMDWKAAERRLGSCTAVYDDVIRRANEVAVLEHERHVGRGVYEEVTRALRQVKPVWALRAWKKQPAWYRVHRVDVANPSDWKVLYAELVVSSVADVARPPRYLFMRSKVDADRPFVEDTLAFLRNNTAGVIVYYQEEEWDAIRVVAGGWDALPAWVAREFDGLALIETTAGGLGKATYQIAEAVHAAGKPVVVVRDYPMRAERVRGLIEEKRDWKTRWGIVATVRDDQEVPF